MDSLMMLILPTHEHSTCFHLFLSFSISFFNVTEFSKYRSFIYLVKFIYRYFFWRSSKWDCFLSFPSWEFILVYKNATDTGYLFCILLFHWILLSVVVVILVECLGFSIHSIMSSANNDSFTSSFPIWMPSISSSCLIAVARTSSTMLHKSWKRTFLSCSQS